MNNVSRTTFTTELLIKNSILSANKKSQHGVNFKILCSAIKLLRDFSISESKPILISSERLCDTSASLFGYSYHKWMDELMPWERLCESIAIGGQITPQITLTLRSPIQYLRSKYLRTFKQRRLMKNERDLSPTEFIEKQITLERSSPGTSALVPAMHSIFIKNLQKHAFVKAFGFQKLMESDDVFSLMGLQGENKYSFVDFPRENKLPFSKRQEQEIEIEITKSLKQHGFYDKIMKAQMFE